MMDVFANRTNYTLPACADIFDLNIFTHYTCIPSIVIILIFGFLETRSSRPNICWGRPALVIPLPLLDGYENRFSFAAAFGAITTTTVSLLFNINDTLPFSFPLWAAALVIQIQVLEACVTCFPVFACIATRHRMVGAILGLLYCSALLGAIVTDAVQTYCKVPPMLTFLQALSVMDYIPIFLCYLYLILRSVHTITVCIRSNTYVTETLTKRVYPHQQQYTRLVLRKDYSPSIEASQSEKLLYRPIDGFKYPVRVVSVVAILVALVYRLTLFLLLSAVQLTHVLESHISAFNLSLTMGGRTYCILTPVAFDILTGVYYVVTCLASALAFFYIYLFMKSYRRHILRLFRGSRHFLLERLPDPQVIMASNLRFTGYQIAYLLWGFLILFLMLLLVSLLLSYTIYFLSVNDYLITALKGVLETFSFPLMALLVFYLQVVLSKYVLMQKKLKVTDAHPPLNVDNRRFYEIFNYYSLFGSLAIGIFSCFWRIIQGLILGIFMVGRLDHSIYSRGWEHRDKGYLSYISMLCVENAHNHPILRVFCDLLLESLDRKDSAQGEFSLVDSSYRPQPVVTRNTQSKRRWHVAYTLFRNPQLQQCRKRALQNCSKRHQLINSLQNDLADISDWPIDDGISCPDERVSDTRKLYLNPISHHRDADV